MTNSKSSSPKARRRPIDVIALGVILIAFAFAMGVLVRALIHREQWNSTGDAARVFGLPALAAVLLLISLRLAPFWRMNVAMILLPAALALYAADFVFAEKARKEAHVVGASRVTRFLSEAPVATLRRRGYPAYSFAGPQQLAYWRHFLHLDSADIYPLGSISGVITYLCHEADEDVLYRSDEYGFNNPRGIWGKPIDLAIVGDSFAHGVCVPTADQIANIARASIPATVNVGVLGAGPMAELGVVREYLAPSKPRAVAWLFYEGNDVDTVGQQPVMARRYLDSRFTQNLVARQPEIDTLLKRYSDVVARAPVERTSREGGVGSILMLRHLRVALGIGLPAPPPKSVDDYQGLENSLGAANREVTGWGGRMYLVYLPDSHRFDPRRMTRGEQHDDRVVYSRTMDIAKRLGIPVVDMLPLFAADSDPKRFWYRPMSHYTPAGTRLVAKTLLARLAKDGVTQ